MKKSAFRPLSLNQATRNNLSVSKFGGVDYSSQKFLVATGRAIDLMNFIYKDGVIQKRSGYEELLKVKDFDYIPASFDTPTSPLVEEIHTNKDTYERTHDTKIDTNKVYYTRNDSNNVYTRVENPDVWEISSYYELISNKQINGIWQFLAEDGQVHVIAHIGHLLYEIKNLDNKDKITCEPILSVHNASASVDGQVRYLAYEFENFKSCAYVGGNKLWFQGGNKYMLLRFETGNTEFIAVENSRYAPIPVTTMSITYKNAISGGRQSLDSVNLLTKWRKNKMISGVTKAEDEKTKTPFFEYNLDAPLIVQSESDMVDIELNIEESGEIK